jgi:hypothetical protein
MLTRTPLVHSSTTPPTTDRATQGRWPLRCLGRSYGVLSFFLPRGPLGGLGTSSSGTQAPCGLGKSKEITFHSLREMTLER